MDRVILHCDLNGFYAAVETLMNPALKDVPMAVAGDPENRHGIILAKNELAKKYNIKTAETIWQAKKKCPELVLVPPHHSQYSKYSKLVNNIYGEITDLVEPFGIDESWLDVTGVKNIFGEGKEIADRIRDTIRERLGLTVSVGVSFNKIFAKLGSDYKKPDATTVISRDNYKELVFPLPVTDLLYVGKAAAKQLDTLYIKTIGELANSDKRLIVGRLGKLGEAIHDYANGIDDSPVKPSGEGREIKSVGNGMTFKRNLSGFEDIITGVKFLCDEVARRMRRYDVKCNVVQVSIKDPSFKTISRQKTLYEPTNLAKVISDTAMELIKASWGESKPIRTLTITASNLCYGSDINQQLSLLDDEVFEDNTSINVEKQEKLEKAMDKIRDKYGNSAVTFGGILKNDIGIEE